MISLGDLCRMEKGESPTLKTEPGSYPLVVTAAYRRTASAYQLEGPAVCIPLVSSTGHGDAALHRLHYQEGRFALANLLVALQPTDAKVCFTKYLYYLLNTKRNELLVPLMKGTANVSLKIQDIAEVTVELPSVAEQQRVVAKIERLSKKVEEASLLRQQSSAATRRFVHSVLGQIFEDGERDGWEPTKLGSICSFQGGSQPPKTFFRNAILPGYVRLIQIRDFKSSAYKTYVPQEMARRFCSDDDVMIGRYGPPVFQILRGLSGAYNVALMKAIPNEKHLTKEFLFYLLQEPHLHKKIVDDSERTCGQSGIRKPLLTSHVMPVPPLSEQPAIVARIDKVLGAVESLTTLAKKTSIEVDALLPSVLDRAFKGEL